MDSLLKLFQRAKAAFLNLPTAQKILYVGSFLVLLASMGYLVVSSNRIEYAPLYSGLSDEDLGAVVEKLKAQKVPYELSGNNRISVPRDLLYDTRLSLATSGVPKGGSTGFEIFDQQKLGSTDFVQKINYQRALQGELARTVSKIDLVEEARVHLVLPEQSLFKEDEQSPSAAVVLKLKTGAKLSPPQAQGIVNLVAGAVPGLHEDKITILSTDGQVIFKRNSSDGSFLNDQQLEYKKQQEEDVRRKVQSMLEQLLGANRVITRVSLNMDFDRTKIAEDTYDPDSAVVRSQQRSTESSQDKELNARGNPDKPVNLEGKVTDSNAGDPQQQAGRKGFNRQRETVNYEINRVSREITHAPGNIRKLSVAVIIDGPYEIKADSDGKMKPFFVARSADEMKTLEDLVRKAVGYDEGRGDQISVSNVPFATDYTGGDGVEQENKWVRMLKENQRLLLNILLMILVFVFVVRPFMKKLQELKTQAGPSSETVPALPGAERAGEQDLLGYEGARELTMKQKAIAMIESDPKRASDIIRAWLRDEV